MRNHLIASRILTASRKRQALPQSKTELISLFLPSGDKIPKSTERGLTRRRCSARRTGSFCAHRARREKRRFYQNRESLPAQLPQHGLGCSAPATDPTRLFQENPTAHRCGRRHETRELWYILAMAPALEGNGCRHLVFKSHSTSSFPICFFKGKRLKK